MDRVWKHFLLSIMIAFAIVASTDEVRGMVVFEQGVAGLSSPLSDTLFSFLAMQTSSMADSAASTPSISPVLSFDGTAPVPPARDHLPNELTSISIPTGMAPNCDSLSQVGGSSMSAALFAGGALVRNEILNSPLGRVSTQRAPAGPSCRFFRPPRMWS